MYWLVRIGSTMGFLGGPIFLDKPKFRTGSWKHQSGSAMFKRPNGKSEQAGWGVPLGFYHTIAEELAVEPKFSEHGSWTSIDSCNLVSNNSFHWYGNPKNKPSPGSPDMGGIFAFQKWRLMALGLPSWFFNPFYHYYPTILEIYHDISHYYLVITALIRIWRFPKMEVPLNNPFSWNFRL